MKKSRVMVIGAVGTGKSTLIAALHEDLPKASKTQALVYNSRSIDTPGEYMENPFFYRAIFATSLEAEVLLFTQDATKNLSVFPPGFAGAFSKRTVGVVTKIDHPEANVAKAAGFLKALGLTGPVVAVSALTGEGMEELRQVLDWNR